MVNNFNILKRKNGHLQKIHAFFKFLLEPFCFNDLQHFGLKFSGKLLNYNNVV